MSVYKVNVSDLTRDFVKYSKYILLCNDHVTIQKYYTMTVITMTTKSQEDCRRMKEKEREGEENASNAAYCKPTYSSSLTQYLPLISCHAARGRNFRAVREILKRG